MIEHETQLRHQLINERENHDLLTRYDLAILDMAHGISFTKALENRGLVEKRK